MRDKQMDSAIAKNAVGKLRVPDSGTIIIHDKARCSKCEGRLIFSKGESTLRQYQFWCESCGHGRILGVLEPVVCVIKAAVTSLLDCTGKELAGVLKKDRTEKQVHENADLRKRIRDRAEEIAVQQTQLGPDEKVTRRMLK